MAGFVARVLVIAGAYFGSAKLGLTLAYEQGNVTAVWPPTGIALAALVLWGSRFWPGVFLGALLANATTDVPGLTSFGIATGNTLEALTGAYILARIDFRPSLSRVRDVVALVLGPAVVSTAVAATIGNVSLLLAGEIDADRFTFFWRLWWLGDMGGDLLVAPVLLLLGSTRRWPQLTRWRIAEACGLTVLVVIVSGFALSPEATLAFLVFPALVVATLRFRQTGAAMASLLVALIAIWITERGDGPFASGTRDENLLHSQLFCGVAALTALLLAAVLAERKRSADSQRFLADTSRLLARSLNLDRTLNEVARSAVPNLADGCVVFGLDESETLEPLATAFADQRRSLRTSDAAVAEVIRTGRPELHSDVMIAPLRARGRMLGALALVATSPRRSFDSADLGVVEDLADRCALAVDNARLYRHEHQVAESLQRSLLPDRLPALAGLEFAARYLPGGPGVEVGGDWYDVIRNPDGELVLVIGDVAGRGVRAASTMGQLRTAARAYALEGHPPAAVLAGVNRLAHAAGSRDMATALCLAYDPASGRLRTANAGHMPPIVISERGAVRSLDGAVALPLNVDASVPFVEAEAVVEPGSTVLLYTDGLIERRGQTLSDSVRELERALEAAPRGAEALCGFIEERARIDDGPPDDVALLAFHVLPLRGKPLQLRFPARPEAIADVRHSLARWLDQNGATADEAASIVLACGEACANAVEHAYGAADAEVEVAAAVSNGLVTLSVRDSGRWRPPRGDHRGRGLSLMHALMDDVTVDHADAGTTVRLALRLGDSSGAPAARPSVTTRTTSIPARDAIDDLIQGDASVRLAREGGLLTATVEGEIDLANARALFGRVVASLDNRALGLIVDLSGTRYLDSSGLQALLDLRQRAQIRGQQLRVVAPANSPPRRVIEAVGAQGALHLCGELAEARAAFRSG